MGLLRNGWEGAAVAGFAGKILITGVLLVGTVSSGINAFAVAAPPGPHVYPAGSIPGLDVSVYQGKTINWPQVVTDGARFVIIRATTGRNPNAPGTIPQRTPRIRVTKTEPSTLAPNAKA